MKLSLLSFARHCFSSCKWRPVLTSASSSVKDLTTQYAWHFGISAKGSTAQQAWHLEVAVPQCRRGSWLHYQFCVPGRVFSNDLGSFRASLFFSWGITKSCLSQIASLFLSHSIVGPAYFALCLCFLTRHFYIPSALFLSSRLSSFISELRSLSFT